MLSSAIFPVAPQKVNTKKDRSFYTFLLRLPRNCKANPHRPSMNRRQFTQSLAALFATPAIPAAALTASLPAGSAVPATAYFWADYMTRLHSRCTPQMLTPFFRADIELAKTVHHQLVMENYLTPSGYAHPNLLARQPTKTFGHQGVNRPQSQPKKAVKIQEKVTMQPVEIRPAAANDHNALAEIWHQGWIEAHAAHVPPELTALRTKDNFHIRLTDMLPTTFVSGPIGEPSGFCTIKNNEIYQMYVSPSAEL
jgi:hypothetical protein